MDLDALLAPIDAAAPCGDDLSFSPEFDAIQEMRRADDPSLDQGEWVTSLKAADWPGVQAECERLLVTRTKDLRIAGWLAEARARLVGYGGLATGLELAGALCERWWEELHPHIVDGDADERSGSLRWLLVQVEALARAMPVLAHGTITHSLRDIDAAQAAAGRPAADDGDATTPAITADTIAVARRATPQSFFALNAADARRALAALQRLQAATESRLGEDGPGFAPARRALEDAAHAVGRLAGDADPSATATADGASADASAVAAGPTTGGALRTRADALRQLRLVADFFRRTEPHSPVAYLADRAAQWGEMPLHEWLSTVVKDQGVLAQVQELLGIAPPPTDAG